MEKKSKVITWKDADQNLCALAAFILERAGENLRNTANMRGTSYPSNGGPIPEGYAEGEGSDRTIFSTSYNFDEGLRSNGMTLLLWDSEGNELGATWFDFQDNSFFELVTSKIDETWKFIDSEGKEFFNFNPTLNASNLTPQCWWSFQNLIRLRLKAARRDLKKNLYQNTKKVNQPRKIKSRNKGKRQPDVSKYGRESER